MPGLAQKYAALPIEKKVGQMFLIGIPGEQLDESTYGLLDGVSPGGICLFARNTRDAGKTRRLIESIRDAVLFEPFFALDQEGGLVDRLRRILEPMPSPADVSRKGGSEAVRQLARITAEAIRILGFNMNFAPVVDVITPQREGFDNGLHSRAMGISASEAAELTRLYLEELQSGGVIGCIKHFPGIGAAEVDSHNELPLVMIGEEEMNTVDLVPYREHFASGTARAVMTGHAAFPGLSFQETDEGGRMLPTSLSRNVVTTLLREKMGFRGISLTDDLEMGAIVRNYGIGEACVMAVEAGHDLILICNSLESVEIGYRAVLASVINGRVSELRLDKSLERISEIRKDLHPPLDFETERLEELSDEIRGMKEQL